MGYDHHTDMGGTRQRFLTTQWSLIENIKAGQDKDKLLIGFLLQEYWKPAYCYLRRAKTYKTEGKELQYAKQTAVRISGGSKIMDLVHYEAILPKQKLPVSCIYSEKSNNMWPMQAYIINCESQKRLTWTIKNACQFSRRKPHRALMYQVVYGLNQGSMF